MHDFVGYLFRRGTHELHCLGHLDLQRIAVYERNGERRYRGLAAQDGCGQIDDATHEVRRRFVVTARADDVGALDETVRGLALEPAALEPETPDFVGLIREQ